MLDLRSSIPALIFALLLGAILIVYMRRVLARIERKVDDLTRAVQGVPTKTAARIEELEERRRVGLSGGDARPSSPSLTSYHP